MLAAIGLGEADVYITNVVYWRPPGNRTPTPQRFRPARRSSERQIELVDPDVLVLLGGAAAKQLFDTSEGIMRLRGKWRDQVMGGKQRRAIATLHPAYLCATRRPSGSPGAISWKSKPRSELEFPVPKKRAAGLSWPNRIAHWECEVAMSRIDESIAFVPVRIAVLTVSDTRTEKTDSQEPCWPKCSARQGHGIGEHGIVKDDVEALRAKVKGWIDDPRSTW